MRLSSESTLPGPCMQARIRRRSLSLFDFDDFGFKLLVLLIMMSVDDLDL